MRKRRPCPFVNRPDARCGQHLSLDKLDHAFEFCFDTFNACPVYLERLVERRVKRLTTPVTTPATNRAHGQTLVQLGTPAKRRPAFTA
jgi:hypothetical protein